jgi:competence protein CoiA
MKYALANEQRSEAQPGLSGKCPCCDAPMVAKCGDVNIWHWAHLSKRVCDPWWENETEWHRAWKGHFPVEWQEVLHRAEDGEKHIADVKTDQGWAIEFQHSPIKPDERRSRDAFYGKLCWVVDATKRKRDKEQFLKAVNQSVAVGAVRRILSDKCVLLREWGVSSVPVFFDFGPGPTIWWLLHKGFDGTYFVGPFSRADFIEIHRGGATAKQKEFSEFVKDSTKIYSDYVSRYPRRP